MEITAVLVTRCGCSREVVVPGLTSEIAVPLTRKPKGGDYIDGPEPKYLPLERRVFRFHRRVGKKAWYVEVS